MRSDKIQLKATRSVSKRMRRIGGKIVGSIDESNHFSKIVLFDSLPLPLLIAPCFFRSFDIIIVWVLGWQWFRENSGSNMKLLTIDMVSVAKEEPRVHIAVDVIKLVEGKNNYKRKGNPRQDCSD